MLGPHPSQLHPVSKRRMFGELCTRVADLVKWGGGWMKLPPKQVGFLVCFREVPFALPFCLF